MFWLFFLYSSGFGSIGVYGLEIFDARTCKRACSSASSCTEKHGARKL
jgi:hypothetical protein